MELTECPIGVFDSGVGGISVLRELVKELPTEHFLFFGDAANAPYGIKEKEEVRNLTEKHVTYFLEKGCKAVVIACNTATSAAAADLRKKYPEIPIIGIEPALKPAVLASKTKEVLVMATPMTLQEKKFQTLMERFQEQATIYKVPTPKLVELVERGCLSGPEMDAYLEEVFAPYKEKKIDAIVLGCTHFPFAKEAIQAYWGDHVQLFDGAAGTARELKRRLQAEQKENASTEKGSVVIESSLGEKEISFAKKLLLQV